MTPYFLLALMVFSGLCGLFYAVVMGDLPTAALYGAIAFLLGILGLEQTRGDE
jgi:hypothetical protein